MADPRKVAGVAARTVAVSFMTILVVGSFAAPLWDYPWMPRTVLTVVFAVLGVILAVSYVITGAADEAAKRRERKRREGE